MIIYLDYVFFINCLFDLILLVGVSMLLKRSVSFFRILIGVFFGGVSSFIVFFNVSSIIFFFLKIITGIIMIVITFNYRDIKYCLYNFFYLMILSIILGGSLYLFNIGLGFEHSGFLFFSNGKSFNTIILLIFSFVILYIYIKFFKLYKTDFFNMYKVKIYIDGAFICMNGFLDSGNTLCDPYFNRPVFIVNSNCNISSNKFYLIPFRTISGSSLMKCFLADKVIVNKNVYKNVMIGISPYKFNLSGVDIILNKKILEDI